MIILANTMLYVTGGAIFIAIAVGLWLIFDTFFLGQTKSESRLDQMRRRALGETEIEEDTSGGAREGINKLLEQASPKLAGAIQPKTEKDVNKLRTLLDSAGFRTETAPEMFLTIQVLSGIFGLVMGGIGSVMTKGFNMTGIMYALAIAGLFFFLPKICLLYTSPSPRDATLSRMPSSA